MKLTYTGPEILFIPKSVCYKCGQWLTYLSSL